MSQNTFLVSLLLYIIVFHASIPAVEWEIDHVDVSPRFSNMTDRHLRMDSQGNPHIAYGEGQLYYQYYDGEEWHKEVADTSMLVGMYASLVLDGSDNPHIAYFDELNSNMKYAYRNSTGWHAETVDDSGDISDWTAIDLDPSGNPHIAYSDTADGPVRYAHLTDTGWIIENVGDPVVTGETPSLVIDETGRPHMVHHDPEVNRLLYSTRDRSGWSTVEVDSGLCGRSSLVLDSSGEPHIAYRDLGHDIRYAHRESGVWVFNEFGYSNSGGCTKNPSLCLDQQDNPHIVYEYWWFPSDYHVRLRYVHRTEGDWEFENVAGGDAHTFSYDHVSLCIKSNGYPGITYTFHCYGYAQNHLRYREKNESGWNQMTVDSGWYTGVSHVSLVNDDLIGSHIAYYDQSNTVLKYAARNEIGWYCETVDSTVNVYTGSYAIRCVSNAIGADGVPHIIYHSSQSYSSPGYLYHAYRYQTGWNIELVQSGSFGLGRYSSVALDSYLFLHVAYAGHSPGSPNRLFYAFRDETGWLIDQVDVDLSTGEYVTLRLDSENRPHICCRAVGEDVNYLFREGEEWQSELVKEGSCDNISMVLSGDELPHVVYNIPDPEPEMEYAYRTSTGWHYETIMDQTGYGLSLMLDAVGGPIVSFGLGSGLCVAYRDTEGWHIVSVDEEAQNPWFNSMKTSITSDRFGDPHIAYNGRDMLNYATGRFPPYLQLDGNDTENELVLTWNPVYGADGYWIYGTHESAFFNPGISPGYEYRITILPVDITTWTSSNGVGNPENNWIYLVMAVDDSETEIARSNRVGEWDWGMELP